MTNTERLRYEAENYQGYQEPVNTKNAQFERICENYNNPYARTYAYNYAYEYAYAYAE